MGSSHSNGRGGTAQEKAEQLQQAMEDLMQTVEKNHLRKLQKQTFLCSANCCDAAANSRDLQACVSTCEAPAAAANQFVEGSIKEFQGRIYRCLNRCEDKAKEKLSSPPTEDELKKAQEVMGECTGSCADEFVKLVPKLTKDIEAQLKDFTQKLNAQIKQDGS